MNLAAVSLLSDHPETRTWYRGVGTRYLTSAIATAHTIAVPSRFYDPITAFPQFATLLFRTAPWWPCSRRKPCLVRPRRREDQFQLRPGLGPC